MPSYVTQSIFVENKTTITQPSAVFSIGACGLFTNENIRQASNIQYNDDGFIILKNNVLEQVAEMFGVDSMTYKGVRAMKIQQRNLFNLANGRLVIMRTNGTNATRASYTTISITETIISALQKVTDGYIGINVDGNLIKLTKLDFSKIQTVKDIADVFNKQSELKCDISIDGEDKIKFTSKTLGTKGSITMEALTDMTGTDLSTSTYLDITNGSVEPGVDGTDEMSIPEGIDYYSTRVLFCCFTTVQEIDVDVVKAINDKLKDIEEQQHKVFVYNAPSLKAVRDINNKIFAPKGGMLQCMHLIVSSANLSGAEAIKNRCAVLSYACGTDTGSNINGKKVSLQGKTFTDIDLSGSKFDNQMVNEILELGVSTYQYILEQNIAMFRVPNNNWAPEDLVNYANIVNTIQTSLTARFNTEKTIDKTNEDLQQTKIFIESILQRFADNKVFGDWSATESIFDGPGQNEGMREALMAQKYFVYIPRSTDIEGFIVPIYIYFKIAGVVVKFILNQNVVRN